MSAYDERRTAETRQDRVSHALSGTSHAAPPEALDGATAAPWIDALLAQAIALRVTDVHLDLAAEPAIVRYRIDGELYPARRVSRSSSMPILRALATRARITGATGARPSSGCMSIVTGGRAVTAEVFVVPTRGGERVVIRILEPPQRTPDDLGLSRAHLALLRRLIARPSGLFISTGPTSAGKSTTLYALAADLARRGRAAVAVEGHCPHATPPLPTIPIEPREGLARAVDAALRRDPEVILIDELLDRAAIELALDVAGTRVVFSASNALSFERLADLGIDPGRARERISAIVHQRLVRALCPACKEAYDTDARAPATAARSRAALYRSVGCAACVFTGFHGRIGVFAFERPAPLDTPAPPIAARLYMAGMRHVLAGATSRDEVIAATSF